MYDEDWNVIWNATSNGTSGTALANNYTVLRLLTVDFMKSAIKLYLRTGFNYCEYENESILTKEEAQSHGLSMELLLK